MTALRVMPPNSPAIWLAESPSDQSFLRSSTRSSVHVMSHLPICGIAGAPSPSSGARALARATDGERYLDFGSGVAVNALGHAHPHLVEAITEQAQKVWHVSNLYRIPEGERLAERLCEATFADSVFFCNSGAEAMECAIKMARKYHAANGQPERFRIITFEGAFHGRTLATLAAGGQEEVPRRLRPEGRGLRPGALRRHRGGARAIGRRPRRS
jgi:acetylornithine/N-succinyldiaminopimelate aminotransferase